MSLPAAQGQSQPFLKGSNWFLAGRQGQKRPEVDAKSRKNKSVPLLSQGVSAGGDTRVSIFFKRL